jgi:hypothetical protein
MEQLSNRQVILHHRVYHRPLETQFKIQSQDHMLSQLRQREL